MKLLTKSIIPALVMLFVMNSVFYSVIADDDDHQKKQDKSTKHDANRGSTPENITYIEQCGACHFAYPPRLLPSKSWEKILESLENHFDEEVEVDPDSKKEITAYLKANSAQQVSREISRKILKSLGNERPMRITEVPYIINQHHEISKEVLGRGSIGSLSNCAACHTTAFKGNFSDDNVKIPE